jgi:methylmalonyl-CoA mutase, N-terminal domain
MATAEDPRIEPERRSPTEQWRDELYGASPERSGELFSTISGVENEPLYTPDNAALDYDLELGYPGVYPFTRGVYPSMYRGRLWTMRQFAGFGTSAETNERFRYLLEHGQTGLSTAFDMPTLMGYDSDHPRSLGEVGREGVAVDSLDDMETLFSGIPLGDVSTSMTINAPAPMLLAFYACVGEKQGVPIAELRGTVQTDILKEYIAQKEWIFPPVPSMRLVVDMIEWCSREMPLMHPISISGYHIREAGSTAAQELAFTLADGFAYVDACIERGLDVDDFAPRLSFFFNAHLDFFEEIAKYRAARRIWATQLREKYGAKNPRSWLMRFHTQTAGVSLTAQQPEVNLIRTAIEALAAVLGGTQSLHTNSFDEALALPTEHAARLALRTQQVIAHETGAVNTIDPLGGSYYVEHLTSELERQAYAYFDRIAELGGVIAAIEENFFQREIAEASYRYQSEVEQNRRIVVGVNRYQLDDEPEPDLLRIDPALEQTQIERVRAVRGRRDARAVEQALARLKDDAARADRNLMEPIMDASRSYVTMGEMCEALRDVWGIWRETPVF